MKQMIQKTTHFGLSLFLLAVLVAGMLAIVPTGSVLAYGAVDQQFVGIGNVENSFSTTDIGQTFVPTVDNLIAVDVYGFSFTTDPQVRVSIHDGNPDGTELAAATITWGSGWQHVDFGAPISLTPGNTYSILLHAISGNPAFNVGTGYSNGSYWECNITCTSYDFDLGFKTYYEAVCPAGQYDNGTGCVPASPGYYVPVAGATSQTPCPVGTYQDQAGAISCKPASAGSYVSATGATTATLCPVGTYQDQTGAISCKPAPAGSYVSATGATSATFCPAGTYQDQAGATSCIPAPAGSYVDTTGATSATPCPAGYTSEAGAVECTRINTAPTANAGGPYLGAINTSIAFDGSASSDPESDSLTYAWDFGDNSSGTGEMPTHSYSEAGIYTVCLTVNDGDLSSDANCTMAVVYDPSAGFVTGGGWIDSPAGAYAADTSLSGKATFGFVAKYKKGANVPDGNTEFQFKAGDLNFHSTSYEWLVVAGNKAQFKGEGTINGQGSYKFMISADDDNPDTFRIQIWGDNGTVYDNGSQQSLGGGSIVVHKGK